MSTDQRSNGTELKGTVELTIAMVLSGTIGIFVVESGASPFNVVFFRCVFGAVALGLYCLVRGFFTDHNFTPRKLGLAALGGVFIVFNWVLLFSSYKNTSISVATVVYHTQPFYVALLGVLLFRDRLTPAKFGWLVVAFGGLVLTAGVSLSDFRSGGHSAYLVGLGQALLAALFYALSTVITKRVTGVRPHLVALVQVTLGIPLLLPFASFGAMKDTGTDWGWLVGLGLIHTCLMYVLMYSAYQKLPTPKIAVLAFVYPAVAMICDWAVYGHRVSLVQALGIPLIVAASLGVNLGWSFPRRPARSEDTSGAEAVSAAPRTVPAPAGLPGSAPADAPRAEKLTIGESR
ncbi:DMT family transporter [Streptomyces galbus]|uniref:DMT family transporter n=1 Tax=Streptomyces galbus TaxID=33898 RepID=A0A4U5X6N0_STRGB|nr:DMT family transporter [Streptomyces galbus]TKT10754.1 DMT family transporter [Streptomyces galbus]GHD20899.1 multidrug DMT transporter permease [Streptomyces galbus]